MVIPMEFIGRIGTIRTKLQMSAARSVIDYKIVPWAREFTFAKVMAGNPGYREGWIMEEIRTGEKAIFKGLYYGRWDRGQ